MFVINVFVTFEVSLLLDYCKEKEDQTHVEEDCEADVTGKGASLTDQLLFISFSNGTVNYTVTDLICINFLKSIVSS